jgi:hypothetical protein
MILEQISKPINFFNGPFHLQRLQSVKWNETIIMNGEYGRRRVLPFYYTNAAFASKHLRKPGKTSIKSVGNRAEIQIGYISTPPA